jgi:hypothetical protein
VNVMQSDQKSAIPDLKSKEMSCIMCGETMFYSEENLVHVCLKESHGILCYYVGDSCWFAAKEDTAFDLQKRGIKYHFIPASIFQNAGIGANFKCDNSEKVS